MGEGLALLPFHALGLPIRETRESRVQLLGQEGPLEEEMEVHCNQRHGDCNLLVIAVVQPLSHVQLFVTPWTVAH